VENTQLQSSGIFAPSRVLPEDILTSDLEPNPDGPLNDRLVYFCHFGVGTAAEGRNHGA
jgi:hypothetical protein